MCAHGEISIAVLFISAELCPADMTQELQQEIQKLRDCISVLFMFVRQPIQDEEFVKILNGWMEQLVLCSLCYLVQLFVLFLLSFSYVFWTKP